MALAASRSGMGLGEARPCRRARARRRRWARARSSRRRPGSRHRRGDVIGRGHVHRLGGTRGRGQFHGVRPALRPIPGWRLRPPRRWAAGCVRAAAISAGQSMASSTRLASTTTGSFSKKLPASAMRLASAALRRSGSALCRTTRIAYRMALLKSRARIQCSSWCGTAAGHGKGPVPPARGCRHDNPPGRFLPVWLREIGVFSAFAAGPDACLDGPVEP